MKTSISDDDILKHNTEFLVIGTFENMDSEEKILIDGKLDNEIRKSMNNKKFKGEFKETMMITPLGKMPAEKLLIIGLGKKEEFSLEKLRKVSGFSAKIAREKGAKSFSTTLVTLNINNDIKEKSQAVVEATIMGLYQFTKFKTIDTDKIKKVDELIIIGNKQIKDEINYGLRRGLIIGESANYVRDLVNYPSVIKTPTYVAEQAKILAKENKLKIKILGKSDLEKEGLNAILAVSRGSSQEPKLVILEYDPKIKEKSGKSKEPAGPIALVGKGITFDSGGLNIKTNDYMDNMKDDMAGAATVMGVLLAAAQLKINKRIIGVLPLTENMPGCSAQKPGDIIKAFNKKTIEMLNSDAEGRLVLADALSYAEQKYKPGKIIDLATLTGACVVALGYHAAGIMGNNAELIDSIKETGTNVYERVWELPMWDEYKEQVKGEVADIANLGKKGMGAGTITAAAFLNHFVEKTPWAHLDIAAMAFLPEERDYMPKNATGWGVRLLVNWLEK